MQGGRKERGDALTGGPGWSAGARGERGRVRGWVKAADRWGGRPRAREKLGRCGRERERGVRLGRKKNGPAGWVAVGLGFGFGSGWVCFPSYFYSISKQSKTI